MDGRGEVKGGYVHGATDEFGYAAVESKVHNLHATILHPMGLDHTTLTYRYAGRDIRLTDVSGKVVRELLACHRLPPKAEAGGGIPEGGPLTCI